MNNNPLFDWYKFYRLEYALSKHKSDEYLRTAINRFYHLTQKNTTTSLGGG